MRRTASLAMVGPAAFAAAAVLAACGSSVTPPVSVTSVPGGITTTVAPPPSPSPPPGSSPQSPTASAPGTPAPASSVPAGWKSFTTGDGALTFNYPEKWTVNDVAPGAKGAAVDVATDYGKAVASLRTGVVAGAECTVKMPFMQYDSVPVPALTQGGQTPRFVFEARTDTTAADPSKATTFAYGVTSEPEPTGTAACPMMHFFTWPPSGASFGGVYDPFDTTPGGPQHADTPEVYKGSAEYQSAKQMIMSLRPAGK